MGQVKPRPLCECPQGVSLPTTQSALNYGLLGLVYGCWLLQRKGGLRAALWQYALLAFLDVEGNFCLVLAYRYTSITSVTLLDSLTIPGRPKLHSNM